MSIAVAAGIGLVVIAVLGILIMTSVVGSAGKRNQNRAEDDEDWERESGEHNPYRGGPS